MIFKTIIQRLPRRQEVVSVLFVCVTLIFIWSIIQTLYKIPSWILYLNTWDLIGGISYSFAFALIESLVIWLMLVSLSVFIPGRLVRNKFVPLATIFLINAAFWAVIVHLSFNYFYTFLGAWLHFIWIVFFVFSLAASYYLRLRFNRLEGMIHSMVDRLSLLAYIYISIGMIGIIIILVRNL